MARQPNKIDPLIREWPRLTRFYGLNPSALQRMPRWLMRIYIEKLPVLRAEEQIDAIDCATYPHAEEGDRKRFYNRLIREAGYDEAPSVDVTAGAGLAALAAMGIQVDIEGVK